LEAVKQYLVKLCPQPSGGAACVTATCATISCAVGGLTAGATYRVSAVAVLLDGRRVPASNALPLVMPSPGLPVLMSAEATGPDTGEATAKPPAGTTFVQVVPCSLPLLLACTGLQPANGSCQQGRQRSSLVPLTLLTPPLRPCCSTSSPPPPSAAGLPSRSPAPRRMLPSATCCPPQLTAW
jgi:hypothetical protein